MRTDLITCFSAEGGYRGAMVDTKVYEKICKQYLRLMKSVLLSQKGWFSHNKLGWHKFWFQLWEILAFEVIANSSKHGNEVLHFGVSLPITMVHNQ